MWETMSKAFDRSIWSNTVRCGGFFWLNPCEMSRLRLLRAEVVEWFALKPCWKVGIGRCSCRVGKTSLSKILIAGQSRETGL